MVRRQTQLDPAVPALCIQQRRLLHIELVSFTDNGQLLLVVTGQQDDLAGKRRLAGWRAARFERAKGHVEGVQQDVVQHRRFVDHHHRSRFEHRRQTRLGAETEFSCVRRYFQWSSGRRVECSCPV